MPQPEAPSQQALITGEELERMGDIGPCELVEGRIVRMSPTGYEHGRIEGMVYKAIVDFVQPRKLGQVMVGEVGIFTRRSPDTVRGADVLFISNERFAQRKKRRGFLDVAPELIVEILSPEDRPGELDQKLTEYFAAGVRLVWVVDPDARTVSAYRSLADLRELKETDTLTGDEVLPGFELPVASLFED